jgi:hypothetical protein
MHLVSLNFGFKRTKRNILKVENRSLVVTIIISALSVVKFFFLN